MGIRESLKIYRYKCIMKITLGSGPKVQHSANPAWLWLITWCQVSVSLAVKWDYLASLSHWVWSPTEKIKEDNDWEGYRKYWK